MVYFDSIKQAIFLFPFIALLFTIPFILAQYHRYGSINKLRVLIVYSFILYMITIYFLVILPLPDISLVRQMKAMKPQLIPFHFVVDIVRDNPLVIGDPSTYIKAIFDKSIYVVIFNIFMTIPFGMYLRYYYKCSLGKTVLMSFLLSLFFEVTQLSGLYFIYPKAYRLFDVDDLILNTFGGFIGYYLMGMIKILPSRDKIDSDAIKAGEQVSGLRRKTLFWLDVVLFLVLYGIIYIIFRKPYIKYIVFFLYYILIPILLDCRTLASTFLNVRYEFHDHKYIRMTFKTLLEFIYYFVLPYSFIYLMVKCIKIMKFGSLLILIIVFLVITLVFIFYIVSIIRVLRNKNMPYDVVTRTNILSTIKGHDD